MSIQTKTKLNPEQQLAVEHEHGPLMIVAGAGTGKTTVITERIYTLIIDKKIPVDGILALTFTEKAAHEMEERIDRLLPYGYVDLWVYTFHGFCERIVRAHAFDIGLSSDFKIYTQTDSWLLVKKNLDAFDLEYYKPLGNPTKFIHVLLNHFSRCKDEQISALEYIKYAEGIVSDTDDMEGSKGKASHEVSEELQEAKRVLEVANAYHTYQQLLHEHNALDFGDVIIATIQLLRTRPKIRKKYQAQFKHILVDEFQDTNWAQYELVKLLLNDEQNITVVGDDDQSVYKFRGASISNILNFKNDFPEAKEVFLQTNYRNPQNVLDASYDFVALNNPNRLEVKLQAAGSTLSKKLHAFIKEKPGIYSFDWYTSFEEEVCAIIDSITKIHTASKSSTWSDFVILVRANDTANAFVSEFEARGIPYQFLAARGLYLKPVVRDILNYFKLLDDYRESTAVYRILRMPVVDMSEEDIVRLTHWTKRKQWSLYEALKHISTVPDISAESITKAGNMLAWIERHTAMAKEASVWKVMLAFLQDTGYLKKIESLPPEEHVDIFKFLNQFAEHVKAFERTHDDISVHDFLEEFELELAAGDTGSLEWDADAGPDFVKIMTMHAAKGLEFEYVYIPSLVDKRFPTIARKEPIEIPESLIKEKIPEGDHHLEEERRLMYVAMTRAKQGLFLSGASDYGGARPKKPSQFAVELGFAELAKTAGIKSKVTTSTKNFKASPITQKKSTHAKPTHSTDTFSFTQLQAYRTCPLQYRYAHVLRIPVKGKYTFSFGKSMHATLQKFFELVKTQANSKQSDLFGASEDTIQEPTATLKDLLEIYETSWLEDWYDSKEHQEKYKQKGKEALKHFYQTWEQDKKVPLFLEKGFNVKIGDYTLKGVMDRVDTNEDGTIEIIDYKTGNAKTKNQVDKTQLLIYQLAADQALNMDVSALTFYYLDDGSQVSFLGTEKQLTKMQSDAIETIEKIISGNFNPTPSPHACTYCDFNTICEFAQL